MGRASRKRMKYSSQCFDLAANNIIAFTLAAAAGRRALREKHLNKGQLYAPRVTEVSELSLCLLDRVKSNVLPLITKHLSTKTEMHPKISNLPLHLGT